VLSMATLLVFVLPSVALDTPPATPRLTLSLADSSLDVLTWPSTTEDFYLETSTDLIPPIVWTPVGIEAQTEGALKRLALPRAAGFRLYQLRRDPDLASLMFDYARRSAADFALVSVAGHEDPDLPFLDTFSPRRFSPLSLTPRVVEGGFVLTPGLWEIHLRSFCAKMGTPGPGEGDGFLSGPFEGPRATIVAKVLRGYSLDPDGDQESTQILLWAIILRARIDTLPASIQALASAYLSPDELRALNTAADRKAALDAAHSQRFIRFFLGPNGLFSELPEDIRKTLIWDDPATDALSRSGVLSFEEVQNLVFLASPPALPPGPVRTIAFGRWSWVPSENEPPGGYLIRHLIASYDQTLVQLCVPQELAVETDDLGRITRIADGIGDEIRATYDVSVPPLSVAGDDGVRGYAFASLALTGPVDPDDPRRLLRVNHGAAGWVLTGTPAGGGTPVAADRFPGATARYQWALAQRAELQRLDAELTRVHPGRPPGPAARAARLLQLAHFCEALRLALPTVEPEDGPEFPLIADRLGLAYRAWVAEFARFAAGTSVSVSPALAAKPDAAVPTSWHNPFKSFMKWYGDWLNSGRKAQPSDQGQQDVTYSSKPTQEQTNKDHPIVQQYQQATKPVRLLLGFLPLPGFLAINKVTIEGGIVGGLNFWGRTTDKVFGVESEPVAPGLHAAPRLPSAAPAADFTTPTVEHFWDPGPILVDPGTSQRRLDATRLLADTFMRVGAHLYAAQIAHERQQAAFQAGDMAWYRRQGACGVAQHRAAGAALWNAADAVVEWTAVLREENVDDPWVTKAELLDIIHRLRTAGLSATEVETLHRAGLSDAEIDACRRWPLDWVPTEEGYSLFGRMEELAETCRQFGSYLLELPDPFWPGSP
jgi:hypothetical protein